MIKLKSILDEVLNSEEYRNATLSEAIDIENYSIVFEWINLSKSYDYDRIGKVWYRFIDKNNTIHEIRIIKGKNDRFEVKLYFLNSDKKPLYDRPSVYLNNEYDEKIFSTYFKIFVDELLPYFFSSLPEQSLYLPATDKLRFRLYRIFINNHLDKSKYSIDLSESENTIIIKNIKK